jgi:PAS domain S-box-containing protein
MTALASFFAMPLQAEGLPAANTNALSISVLAIIVVLSLAWVQALRTRLRRAEAQAGMLPKPEAPPGEQKTQVPGEYEGEFLRSLLEHSSDQIYFKDRDSRFLLCSEAVARKWNTSVAGVVGKTDFDIFDDLHARPAYEDEQEIIRTGKGFHGKVEREVMKDGTEYWALSSKMPLRNKAGEIIGTFGISKDITDLKRTESQLAYERDLLNTLLDNTPDTIYFKDIQSRFVRVSRSKVEQSLASARLKHQKSVKKNGTASVPDHLADATAFAGYLAGKTDFDFFPEDRARPAFEDEQQIIRTGTPLVGKLEETHQPDGKTTWCVTTKMPWHNADGAIIGTFGLSKDVTFIKEAEAKLEKVHKQLLDASRLAGMAEVATTVLHNVGNVLNSVNVSASVVADRVKNSKTCNLVRAAEMLKEHDGDLAEFLMKDPRGAKLPSYLATLAESLTAEQKEMLGELASLRANIEHINEIVAMQQAYARVAGLQESLNPTDLIEDALRLNAGAVERHHIHVVREYSPTPSILVDKHKVLQILVNLIRNAKYALDDRDNGDKRMTLRAALGENRIVKISIIDNGVGIAPENIKRIFEYGFTTRQNGHGFALHSGALAARQMGGSLTCQSGGVGHGANFTLELPLSPPEKST